MPATKYTEEEFLSGIICPAYIKYKYNLYEQDISQSIANRALKIFLNRIKEYHHGQDLDLLISKSTAKAMHSKLKLETVAYKKSVQAYSYNFIYKFFKKFPPSEYHPLLIDLDLPVAYTNFEIDFHYDIILKDLDKENLIICDYIHKKDFQIENNIDYFLAKFNLFSQRVDSLVDENTLKYNLYYMSKLKHSPISGGDAFTFLPLSKNIDCNIFTYLEVFRKKLDIKKNPFCMNYSCTKRKDCQNA
jgi:hypothetical protein